MRALIDSLRTRITDTTPYLAYFGEVTGTPDYPYVLLWSSPGQLASHTLSGPPDLSDSLGVTMVATTCEGVLSVAHHVRATLRGFAPDSDQWRVEPLRQPYDSQAIQPDRDVSLPHAGHPFFAVDLYRLEGTQR